MDCGKLEIGSEPKSYVSSAFGIGGIFSIGQKCQHPCWARSNTGGPFLWFCRGRSGHQGCCCECLLECQGPGPWLKLHDLTGFDLPLYLPPNKAVFNFVKPGEALQVVVVWKFLFEQQ